MPYPSLISALSNPQPTDRLNSPSHSSLHQAENTGINEIQTFVGTLSSTQGTLIYDIRSSNSNGGGHVQTANTGGTGQITYNKGDILIAQSSSVLTKLAVGADTQALIADSSQAVGIKWATPSGANVQSFVSNGVWFKPSTLSLTSPVLIQLWGGGGSGGDANSTPGNGSGGGGGGGGGFIQHIMVSSLLTSSVAVTVGAVQSVSGTVGNDTIFGTFATAYAGGGGGSIAGVGAGGGGGGAGITTDGNSATAGGGATGGGIAGATASNSNGGFGGGGGGGSAGNGGEAVVGGGGGGGSAGGGAGGNGGNAIYGGAGGGGGSLNTNSSGGTSKFGGNGGAGMASVAGLAGTAPGGGGGGGGGGGAALKKGGNGAAGFAIITSFP